MKAHFRFLCLCLAMLCVGVASRAQLSGPITVPSTTYPTLASVITALNTVGVGASSVTINFTASTNETAPVGGYKLGSTVLNASTSASKTITINGNGNVITAYVGTSTSADGMFYIQGTDYVTINNLYLNDPAANTTTTTQMEWGYVLCKLNTSAPYDGCQNDKINGCNITLRSTASTTTGIFMAHIAAGSSSVLSTSSAAFGDGNHYNKFTGNVITGVARGIYMVGISTLAQYDKGTEVGGTTSGSGNNITVGFSGVANTSYGIYSQNDSVETIQSNSIAIASGHGNATVYGIYNTTGKGSLNVLNNVVNLSSAVTSASMYGWYNPGHSDVGAVLTIQGNTVTGTNTASTSAYLYGYYNSGSAANFIENANALRDVVWAGTSGYIYGYYNTVTNPKINITNNMFYNVDRTSSLTSTTSTYYIYGFYNVSSSSNPADIFNVSNNTVRKVRNNYYIYSFYNQGYTSTGGQRLIARGNTVDSIDLSTSSTPYLYNYIGYYGSDSSDCSYNTVKNVKMSLVNTTSGSIINYFGYMYYAQLASWSRGNKVDSITCNACYISNYAYYCRWVDSNVFSNIKWGQGTTPSATGYMYNYIGMYNQYTNYVKNTRVFNINGIGQSLYSYMGYSTTGNSEISYNSWKDIVLGGSGSAYNYMGYSSSACLIQNNVWDNISLGTGSFYPLYTYVYNGPDTIRNNKVTNITVTTGTNNSIYPYYLTGSGSNPIVFYNNILSNVNLPATWSGSGSFYGVYMASAVPYKVYNNTIYINPGVTGTGAGFGATGMYYSSAVTSLDYRNNLVNVNMVPGTSGITAALRRSTGTGGTPPANLDGTSDGNIYYAPNVANSYLYTEGSTTNAYNLTNDPNFNTPCGLFKQFMGHDKGSFTENNLAGGAVTGIYAPTGTSFAESGAVPTNGYVPFDFNYVPRPTLPDIGSVEFSGTAIDQAPPSISYTPVPKTSYCVSAPTLVATITDVTGVNTTVGTAPRLYYKKSSENNTFGGNTSATNGWKYVEPAGVSGNLYTFNMDYTLLTSSVTPGDSITYFVIAQDLTTSTNTNATIASFTQCPTTVALTSTNAPVLTAPMPNGFKVLNTPVFKINAFPVGLCGSGNVSMAVTPVPVGATIQWQQATLTGTFANITGATAVNYASPLLTNTTRYRVQIFCGTSVLATTPIDTIIVANPAITATTPATRCGYGNVTLSATVAAPATVNWYTAASGGQPVFTGNPFTTPNLFGSKTYYASGVVPHAATEAMTPATPTSSSNYTYGNGYGIMFTLKNASTHIYSTTVYPMGTGAFSVDLIDNATSSSVATAGPFSVAGGGLSSPVVLPLNFYNVPAGDYTMVMTGYTGSPSLVIDYLYPSLPYPFTSPSGNGSIYGSYIYGGNYAYYYAFFYNTQISANCQTARQAVVATVTPATPIVASSPSSPGICTGGSAVLNVTSANFSYLYAWTPGAATGNSITVSPAGTTKYYVIGTDYSTMCSAIDSVNIQVTNQPAPPNITPVNPAICQGGQVALTGNSTATAAGTGIVGTATNSTGAYGYPTPWNNDWTGAHDQYLVRQSELAAAGILAGNLTSVSFYQDLPYSASSGGWTSIDNYRIQIAPTTNTAMTASFVSTNFTTVATVATFTPSTTTTGGWVTYTFSTPFPWNGSDNIIVDVSHMNCNSCPATSCVAYNYGGNASCRYSTYSYTASAYTYADANCSVNTFTPSSSIQTSTARPNMMFGYGSPYYINWQNVTGLYKTTALTTAVATTDTNRTVYASPATTQIYTAVVNANGCLSLPSAPDTVKVTPSPIVTVTPAGPQTICSGNSVTLTIPSAALQTYQWYLNGILIPGATSNAYNATGAGNYTVTATNTSTSCAATSIIVPVTVNTLPTASITAGSATTFCNGNSVLLTATAPAAVSYQWKLNGSNITTGGTGTSFTATASGNYTVTVQNAAGCSQTSNAITVTVNTTPSTVTPATSTTFCTGQSVVLNGPTPPTGTTFTYQWYNGTTPVGTGSTYTASTSGSYTVVVTNTGTTCVSTSTPVVVVSGSTPPAPITPAVATGACVGTTLSLGTNPSPGLTYQWYKNGTSLGASQTNSTLSIASVTAADAGSYTVTVSSGPGCTTTSPTPTVVTVNALPAASFTAAGPTTFCSGVGVALNSTSGTGLGYQWNLNGTSIGGATAATYNANATGNYTLTTTNATTGCSNTSAALAITANALPNPVATPATNPTFCSGGNVVISVPATAGLTYQWRLNGTPITGSTGTSITASATGNYTVTATNSNGCVGTSQVVSVLVNALPNVTTVPTGNATICQGSTTTLSVPNNPGQTYSWSLNGSPLANTNSYTYTTGTGGSYTTTVTNTVTGCIATSTPVTVTVSAPPSATASAVGATTFCNGDSVRINANLGTGYTYQWRYNGIDMTGKTGDNVYAKQGGAYTVRVTNAAGCTTTSNAVLVTVNPTPPAYITYNTPLTFCEGSAVVLNANGGTGLSYLWMYNGVPTTNTTGTNIASTTGVYSVKTTNTFGCSTMSDTLNVLVNPKPLPVIIRTHDTLVTSASYLTYQWFFNNVAIAGATTNYITFNQNGAYKVRVSDPNGCDGFSEILFMNSVGVASNPISRSIKVFPNPTNGIVHIDASVKVKVSLRDVTGKAVIEASDVKEVDLGDVANGTYLLYITNMQGQLLKVEKVTKTNN